MVKKIFERELLSHLKRDGNVHEIKYINDVNVVSYIHMM